MERISARRRRSLFGSLPSTSAVINPAASISWMWDAVFEPVAGQLHAHQVGLTGASSTPSRVATGGEKSGTASEYRCTALLALGFAASTSISTPAACRYSKPKWPHAIRDSIEVAAVHRHIDITRHPCGQWSFSETCRKTATPPTTRCSIPAACTADVARFNTSKSCSTCSSYAVAEITGLWSQYTAPTQWVGANLRNAKSRATANASNRGGGAPRLIPGESRFYLRGSLRMKGDRATRHSERLRADGNGPRPRDGSYGPLSSSAARRWTSRTHSASTASSTSVSRLSRSESTKAALASTGNASAFSRISVNIPLRTNCSTASHPGLLCKLAPAASQTAERGDTVSQSDQEAGSGTASSEILSNNMPLLGLVASLKKPNAGTLSVWRHRENTNRWDSKSHRLIDTEMICELLPNTICSWYH